MTTRVPTSVPTELAWFAAYAYAGADDAWREVR